MKRQRFTQLITLSVVMILAGMSAGCSTSYVVEGVFTHPAVSNYNRLAMTGLSPEREQLLMSAYVRAFSDMSVVFIERAKLQDLLQEQDLLPERLDAETRARLARVLGVQGIIFADYSFQESEFQKIEKLLVRIVGTETGEIVGSALVEARSRSGVRVSELANRAAVALRYSLHTKETGSGIPPGEHTYNYEMPASRSRPTSVLDRRRTPSSRNR